MARDTQTIKGTIVDAKNAQPDLDTLDSDSQVATWNLWAFVTAQAVNFLEQLFDILKSSLEATALKSVSGTPSWIRQRVLEFQYDAVTPQIAQIINNQITYPTVDSTKRIISRVSVKTNGVGAADVKVAQQEPPIQLDSGMALALAGYLNTLDFAGITINLVNDVADKLYVEANVFYDGQFSATIQNDVETSINNYLLNLSSVDNFDGTVKVSDVEKAIKDTPGVIDVKLISIRARQDTTVFASASLIYDLATSVNVLSWPTVAGYIVEETTSGKTFADKITYTIV